MDLVIDQSIKWRPDQQRYIDDDGYPADFKFTNASLKSKAAATTTSDTINLTATSSVNINAPVYSNTALFRCEYWATTDQTVNHSAQTDVTFDSLELMSGTAIITKVANSQFKNTSGKPIMVMVHASATTPDATEIPGGTVFTCGIRHLNASDNLVGTMGEYACSNVNQTAFVNFNTHATIYLKPNEYIIYSLKIILGGAAPSTLLAGGSKSAANIGRLLTIQQIG